MACDHDRLALVLLRKSFECFLHALDHHVDALRTRGGDPGAVGVDAERVDRTEPLVELAPQDAVGFAGVLLAQAAVLADVELTVADTRRNDLRGLVGAAHEARVEDGGAAQLARSQQPVAQESRLRSAVIGQALAGVAGDDLLGEGERLAVTDEDDAGHARWSTNPSSWRRLRHSKTPSQWMPYSPTIESPVSQYDRGSGLSQYTWRARCRISLSTQFCDAW